MANLVLRQRLAEARLTERQLAQRVGVDPATVGRWISDEHRTPQPRVRWKVAEQLGCDEVDLWPAAARTMMKTGPDREIVSVYPTHSAVPKAVWRKLIGDAVREIALVGYAPYWLTWQVPDLVATLRDKAAAGCRVRVVFGDPTNPLVQLDEQATGTPLTLTTRIEQTRHLLEPLRDVVEVRQTAMGFGRSIYRGDDEGCADWWLHGAPGTDFPVLHLRRRQDGGLFDQLAVRHVDALWEAAQPIEA